MIVAVVFQGVGLVPYQVYVSVVTDVPVGIKVCPAMFGPPKYASAFSLILGNMSPFAPVDCVAQNTFPSLSVTASAVIILTVL